jgi:hypothetical protein
MKAGWKTTEFWLTIAAMLLGILAALGYITPEQQTALNAALVQILGGLMVALSAFGYQLSRGTAKSALPPGQK